MKPPQRNVLVGNDEKIQKRVNFKICNEVNFSHNILSGAGLGRGGGSLRAPP